jgi:Protein of unknown function (DUF3455)
MQKKNTITAAILLQLFLTVQVAHADTTPPVPLAIQAPSNQTLLLEARATGVQIYECNMPPSGSTSLKWIFKGPEADLFDLAGKKIGKHYAGPTWELNNGSKVVGTVKAQEKSPDVNAIPWLLLATQSSIGTDAFSQTQSIQRIYTSGGKAPGEECSKQQVGQQIQVNYSATYLFYIMRP